MFQFRSPSISAIRAKLLMEKLRELSSSNLSITLCATGRTGSGKTTLGNRLVGIDYFMPSTGFQDCTDEVNKVKFPSGPEYFDLPGVASKGDLENYNRAALGIAQREKFQKVEKITLATYSEDKQTPERQQFEVSDFKNLLKPNLVIYLVASDKQFLDIDCLYLGDFLTSYTEVIYVLNIFADKQTGSHYATEQNITDITNRITDVHTSVLGSKNQPAIAKVNCWTGEGFSELLEHCHRQLGNKKGSFFEELVQYQQQKTPVEYLRSVKQELLKLFAYVACQKPDESYCCDQELHKCCRILGDFLANLNGAKIKQVFENNIADSVTDVWSTIPNPPHFFGYLTTILKLLPKNRFRDFVISKIIRLEYDFKNRIMNIQERMDLLSEEFEVCMVESHNMALEFREQIIQLLNGEFQSLNKEIILLEQKFHSNIKKHDSLVNEIKSLEREIQYRVEKSNLLAQEINSQKQVLQSRYENGVFREKEYEYRRQVYNSTVAKANSSWWPVSPELQSYFDSENDFFDREEYFIKVGAASLSADGEQHNMKAQCHAREKNAIEQKKQLKIRLINSLNKIEEEFKSTKRLLSEKDIILDKERQRKSELVKSFEKEFSLIEERIKVSREDIKVRLSSISLDRLKELDSLEKTNSFQEEINNFIGDIISFQEEIRSFQRQILSCATKMAINLQANEVIKQCTTYHFDNTLECEYKGSTYQHFSQDGIILLLALAHMIVLDKDIITEYNTWHKSISQRVNKLGNFSSNLTEDELLKLLESKVNSLFDASFDEKIKTAAK